MSRLRQLDTLSREMRRLWTQSDCVLAILRDCRGSELFRISCGPATCKGLVADKCKVWDITGNLLFSGELSGTSLLSGIQTGKVCLAEITTAKRIGKEPALKSMCCGAIKGARCKICELNAEQTTVRCPEEAVRGSPHIERESNADGNKGSGETADVEDSTRI